MSFMRIVFLVIKVIFAIFVVQIIIGGTLFLIHVSVQALCKWMDKRAINKMNSKITNAQRGDYVDAKSTEN